MFHRHHRPRTQPSTIVGAVLGAVVAGTAVFVLAGSFPALRRYLRMSRM